MLPGAGILAPGSYSPKCLEKLSEKGFEQRSKHEFGRYTEHEMGQMEPFGSLWGCAASVSETFRTVSEEEFSEVAAYCMGAPGRSDRGSPSLAVSQLIASSIHTWWVGGNSSGSSRLAAVTSMKSSSSSCW